MQSTGYRYDGDWVDGAKEGTGKITYPDGSVYEGGMLGDLRAGQGKLTMPDGLSYEGVWAAGQMSGQGRLVQPSGDIYEGTMVANRREGQVVYSISVPEVRDLLLAGRRILAQMSPDTVDLDWEHRR